MEEAGNTNLIRGGFRAFACFAVNSFFEQMCNTAVGANLVVYLTQGYNITSVGAATVNFVWNAGSSFLQMVGALLADSCLGCYPVILAGSISSCAGMFVLCLTAFLVKVKPSLCVPGGNCQSASSPRLGLLYTSLFLIASGVGGMRPCSSAFGRDQIPDENDWRRNWFSKLAGISNIIAASIIIPLQTINSWLVGFIIPAGIMILSTLVFLKGSSRYRKLKPQRNILTSFARVIYATLRKINMQSPMHAQVLQRGQANDLYLYMSDSTLCVPSNKLRCLNKACTKDMPREYDGQNVQQWRLCYVEEVEELKSLIRVLPICLCFIVFAMATGQTSFGVLQANTMDRHLGRLKIPAGSFSVFELLGATIVEVTYSYVLAPRVNQRWSGRVRVGLGIILVLIANFLAWNVERVRKEKVNEEKLENNPVGVVHMSAMWLISQFLLTGMATGLASGGLTDLFDSQFPNTLQNIRYGLLAVGMSFGYALGSIIANGIGSDTSEKGLPTLIGKSTNKIDLVSHYLLVMYLCAANTIFYLVVAWFYGPETDVIWTEVASVGGVELVPQGGRSRDEDDEEEEEIHEVELVPQGGRSIDEDDEEEEEIHEVELVPQGGRSRDEDDEEEEEIHEVELVPQGGRSRDEDDEDEEEIHEVQVQVPNIEEGHGQGGEEEEELSIIQPTQHMLRYIVLFIFLLLFKILFS